jgi:hypothetical protein
LRVKFFTTPPRPWPYLLINANCPDLRYLKHAEEVIIDSGVEVFRDPKVKDYPKWHLERLVSLYIKVVGSVGGGRVLATALDYPDDLSPGSLWADGRTNVERTVESVVRCLERYPWVDWLVPIQGRYRDPESVLECIDLYRERGVKLSRVGVANLGDDSSTVRAVRLVRRELPSASVHVFDLSLPALRRVYSLIDSFDSMAWGKVFTRLARSREDLRQFFDAWLAKLERVAEEVERCRTLEGFVGDGLGR